MTGSTNKKWLQQETKRTLQRLLPRLTVRLKSQIVSEPESWAIFLRRLETNFDRLFHLYFHLYKDQYDFFYHLEDLLCKLARMWLARPFDLKELDVVRENDPLWFQSNQILGGVCYVDLFAGDLNGIREKIPYFMEIGLTYLHLMPPYRIPEGESDGGYAVRNYREINPTIGTIGELESLANELRQAGISLALDFVFNHSSDEHEWALKALAGDVDFQDYYYMFPDRNMPDAYEIHLREIFPEEHPGSFTYKEEINKWVWTTFHTYQWDLNYSNPAVFNSMAEEMLFLANIGVEVLRFDAVAFTWKQLGTDCENLPEAHLLIQAFNAITRIAAPALVFKSEAIVHPDEVVKYIDNNECQLSYNPLLMTLLWNSLATREVLLLNLALNERFQIDFNCAWVNYIRCHDDIGWTFSDDDAARLGINGYDHRRFLNQFYTGLFPGSFACGLPFQMNPQTGDARVSGTCASLAGLEKAINFETEKEVALAIKRILLIHGIIITIGGIPLIYLGDEIGTLNDYSYQRDPSKTNDSRWVHRPQTDWGSVNRREDKDSIEGRIFEGLRALIQLRMSTHVFTGGEMQVMDVNNQQVLAYKRTNRSEYVFIFANFTERDQIVSSEYLRIYGYCEYYLDILNERKIPFDDLYLEPYHLLILSPSRGERSNQ
jgi:glycosidase